MTDYEDCHYKKYKKWYDNEIEYGFMSMMNNFFAFLRAANIP